MFVPIYCVFNKSYTLCLYLFIVYLIKSYTLCLYLFIVFFSVIILVIDYPGVTDFSILYFPFLLKEKLIKSPIKFYCYNIRYKEKTQHRYILFLNQTENKKQNPIILF